MILFPYANNVEYANGTLSFGIQFMTDEKTVEISINVGLDEELSAKIEELLETV